jgi:oligo-1,6-glucosidase
VYQGEELGMTNVRFDSVDDFRDIESVNQFHEAVALGAEPADVLESLRRTSRDNARTPMQWTDGKHAGFTTGTPWLRVNPNHSWLNAAAQRDDAASVMSHYRALIALRHQERVVVDGDFRMLLPDHPAVYAFERRLDGQCLAVYANLSGDPVAGVLPDQLLEAELLIGNQGVPTSSTLRPWEARVYRVT